MPNINLCKFDALMRFIVVTECKCMCVCVRAFVFVVSAVVVRLEIGLKYKHFKEPLTLFCQFYDF